MIIIILLFFSLWRAPLEPFSDVVQTSAPITESDELHPPTSQPAVETTTDTSHEDGVIDILNTLEAKGAQLNGFTADVTYAKEDELLGRREIRRGEVLYMKDWDNRQFAILFDTVIINRRKENQLRHYVFDGQWLAEVDHANKQFIKQQIVAPGQTLDPLRIGEGPIPLPIGQRREDVLRRFQVQRIPLPTEGPLLSLANEKALTGLRLTSKPHTPEAEDFTYIDLFYDLKTGLPHGIYMVASNGDTKTVRLTELIANPDFDDQQRAKLQIETPDSSEWSIDVRPWKGDA